MARYDYRCTSCGLVFEVEHPMAERPEITCPTCGAAAEHVFGASAIAFHGSGFFNTDRAGSSATAASAGAPAPKESSSAGESAGCANCPHRQSA